MSVKNLYIASLEPNAGSLIISMGIMEMLKSRLNKIAFFRPVVMDGSILDNDIDFMRSHFNLDQKTKSCYAFTLDEVETLLSEGKEGDIIESVLEKYHTLEAEYDFVLIQGLDQAAFAKTERAQAFNL